MVQNVNIHHYFFVTGKFRPFGGEFCVQSFFHYHDKNGEFKDKPKYDDRKMLGIPMQTGMKMIWGYKKNDEF